MKTFLLLVTWFVQGQPPASYQAQFSSLDTCEAAKEAVFKDADRLRRQVLAESIFKGKALGIPENVASAGAILPTVTAACAAQ
jgi:hypothetical protein